MLVPLIWLVGTLVPMLFLIRWISRHIQGVGLLLGVYNAKTSLTQCARTSLTV